ncbi:MAG: hypothetical protein ACREA0_03830 [bacterium]
MGVKRSRWGNLLASGLAALVLLESCSGSLNAKSAEPSVGSESAPAENVSAGGEEADPKPRRRLWPWAVGGVTTGAVLAGAFILVVSAVAGAVAGGVVPDFGFCFLGCDRGNGSRNQGNDQGPLPLLAAQ